jgi:hypothetical protein
MATQKLQVSSAMVVIPSDTVNISNVAGVSVSSSTTATTANKLVDTTQDFVTLGVKVGDTIINTTDDTVALVTAIDSATVLSISADIMASGESYKLPLEKANSASSCVLYVGVAGDLKVKTASGDVVTFIAAPAGYHPVQVVKVFATGTTATNIVALW